LWLWGGGWGGEATMVASQFFPGEQII